MLIIISSMYLISWSQLYDNSYATVKKIEKSIHCNFPIDRLFAFQTSMIQMLIISILLLISSKMGNFQPHILFLKKTSQSCHYIHFKISTANVTITPDISATLMWLWGLLLQRLERFLQYKGEKQTMCRPAVFEHIQHINNTSTYALVDLWLYGRFRLHSHL